MRIAAIADLHGRLPEIPECDLLLIAGDICPTTNHTIQFQHGWLNSVFRDWLSNIPAALVVAVWGNHDWIAAKAPGLVPDLPWTILTDELVKIDGYRVYGTPWQRRFNNWAFNLDEPELNRKYKLMPECDIIVSHGPPYGYGDYVAFDCVNVGSKAFLKRIDDIKPRLVVFGHIHEEPGIWSRNGTILANVTHVDGAYRPMYGPRIFEI